MAGRSIGFGAAPSPAYPRITPRQRRVAVGSRNNELCLKLLICAIFVPEGLSLYFGDFRLSIARVALILLLPLAAQNFFRRTGTTNFALVPSDVIALMAGVWMIIAAMVTAGFSDGVKGGGALALELVGAYYVFRNLLGPPDSSVRVAKFGCKLFVLVVAVAVLDPLTGKLFTYEAVKGLTGYGKVSIEYAKQTFSTTMYRHGLVRAQGPMEHSILFGTACVWFAALAMSAFRAHLVRWAIVAVALIGVLYSQSQGSLVCFLLVAALAAFDATTRKIAGRWKILGSIVAIGIICICLSSGKPLATFLRLGGVSEETGWYRQAIWETAMPIVAGSPLFGIGLNNDWDWLSSGMLVGDSVDALWLAAAMMFGIPGSVLIFLTLWSAFWLGAVDRSRFLSNEERKLSIVLGFVAVVAVFQGFTVHIWGSCWILLGVFAGMRANLAEAAILRSRAAAASGLASNVRSW